MAASSYDEALKRLLVHEGGYSNHPSDPGGPTNWGITIFDARAYWKKDATAADVRNMPVAVAKDIYRSKYWGAMRCDELAAGVDYAVFDYGVNSGLGRTGKVLRRELGLPDHTSTITDEVIAATAKHESRHLVEAICDERLAFLQGLRTWPVFGNGWGRRVREVRAAALAMADTKATAPVPAPTPGAALKGRKPPLPAMHKVGWGAATAAAVGAIAHWIDAHPVITIGTVVLATLLVLYVFHHLDDGASGRSRPSSPSSGGSRPSSP
jgi:lysozyme family protein